MVDSPLRVLGQPRPFGEFCKITQASIQDNRWVNAETLELEQVKAVSMFLRGLFDLGSRPETTAELKPSGD